MINPAIGTPSMAATHRRAIQTLAERSHASFEVVEGMYGHELSELRSHARITQYLPLLASRRVRDLLRHSRASGSSSHGSNGP